MALHSRLQRVEENLAHTLADLLLRDVKDERLRMANVTHVKVSKDLRHAVVAVSCMSMEPGDMDEMLDALDKAKGWLRRELAARVRLKYVPDLKFVSDTSAAYAARIESLLQEVRPEDEEPAKSEDDQD